MTENEIHKAVVNHLSIRGEPNVFWFHPANGGKRSWSQGKLFKALGVIAGVPDLIFLKSARVYGLELKTLKGRLQPAQSACMEAMRASGAECAVARGLDEALVILECWGILRRGTQ